ncbi:hypothetical protein AB0368_05600 [Actinoplanes sp. NPDC051475]|uniref:hypothetical protein n=1 Tax=Actinoplanes sp. NPDC051475 TaxID=3157225 RepID=UPI0034500E79
MDRHPQVRQGLPAEGGARRRRRGEAVPVRTTTPATVGSTDPAPVRLKDFRDIDFPDGSYDTKTRTFKFDPKTLPKDLLRYSPF